MDWYEVVQLYVRDLYANLTPPFRRLQAYEKVFLLANGQKTVKFTIQTDDLKYVGLDNKWTTEKGDFEVFVEKLSGKFYLHY